jgi:hypothetical protein
MVNIQRLKYDLKRFNGGGLISNGGWLFKVIHIVILFNSNNRASVNVKLPIESAFAQRTEFNGEKVNDSVDGPRNSPVLDEPEELIPPKNLFLHLGSMNTFNKHQVVFSELIKINSLLD